MAGDGEVRRDLFGRLVARIFVRVSYARWPGGTMLCVRIHRSKWTPEQFFLVGRDDRRHELRAYRVGARYGCH